MHLKVSGLRFETRHFVALLTMRTPHPEDFAASQPSIARLRVNPQ